MLGLFEMGLVFLKAALMKRLLESRKVLLLESLRVAALWEFLEGPPVGLLCKKLLLGLPRKTWLLELLKKLPCRVLQSELLVVFPHKLVACKILRLELLLVLARKLLVLESLRS